MGRSDEASLKGRSFVLNIRANEGVGLPHFIGVGFGEGQTQLVGTVRVGLEQVLSKRVSVLTIDTFVSPVRSFRVPRKLRIEYPGAIYHVMNRGDQHEDIFMDDEDRRKFLSTLDEACQKTDWQVHAYCLMRNHFHHVVETPQANLAAGMK